MLMSARRARAAAVTVASLALLTATVVTPGPSAALTHGASDRIAPTPTLKITVSKSDLTVQGPHTFRAGRVAMALTGKGPRGGTAGLVRFKKGYSFHEFTSDVKASNAPPPDGLKPLRRVIRNSTFYGGVAANHGNVSRGTVVLPKPGQYYVYDFGGAVPRKVTRLHVTGPAVKRAAPASDGTLKARSGARWGGARSLPHQGTLTFRNTATDSPHFLELQHVAKGTTRKQVLDCFNDPQCTFDFGRPGTLDTEVLSPGQSMTQDYALPRGTYAQLCFFPDPKTGMPHAFMGMIRIIKLR